MNLKINIFHVRQKAQDQWIQLLPQQEEGLLSYANKAYIKSVFFNNWQPRPLNMVLKTKASVKKLQFTKPNNTESFLGSHL